MSKPHHADGRKEDEREEHSAAIFDHAVNKTPLRWCESNIRDRDGFIRRVHKACFTDGILIIWNVNMRRVAVRSIAWLGDRCGKVLRMVKEKSIF